MQWMRVFSLALFVICQAHTIGNAFSERVVASGLPAEFSPTKELAPYVEFWKLVFTRYGKDELIVHHRENPEIIYSVLDFSAYRDLSDSDRKKKRETISNAEVESIRADLVHLAEGGSADTDNRKRLQGLFSRQWGKGKYAQAAGPDMIRTQTGMKEKFAESIVRSGRYLPLIEQVFVEEGLPKELASIPFVESSFNYKAVSSVGASGIWQFMRATGKSYMHIDSYVDERRDALTSSRAAAKYLKRARSVLGNWPLAITSYNHGVSGIARGVKQVGSSELIDLIRGYRSDYFGFASKNFFVSFLAALEVSRHYKTYFPGLVKEDVLTFDEIKLTKPVSYQLALRHSGMSTTDFQELNPALLGRVLSGKGLIPGGVYLKFAPNTANQVVAALKSGEITAQVGRPFLLASADRAIPSARAKQIVEKASDFNYVERSSDSSPEGTVASRSRRPGRDPEARALLSQLRESGEQMEQEERANQVKDSSSKSWVVHLVKPGETVWGIASRYGLSTRDLLVRNKMSNSSVIKPGQSLKIKVGDSANVQGSEAKQNRAQQSARPGNASAKVDVTRGSPEYHLIKQGDTLYAISIKYGIPLAEVKKLNPELKPLKPGGRVRLR